MLDIHTIAETFTLLSGCVSRSREGRRGDTDGILWPLYDPHDDADAWLAASDNERSALRAAAELRHKAIVAELGRTFTRDSRLAWRLKNPEKQDACRRRWRETHREYSAEYMRKYRADMAAKDPVGYQAALAAARERKRMAKEKRNALGGSTRAERVSPPTSTRKETTNGQASV
jgi:hypothetical protein